MLRIRPPLGVLTTQADMQAAIAAAGGGASQASLTAMPTIEKFGIAAALIGIIAAIVSRSKKTQAMSRSRAPTTSRTREWRGGAKVR